LQVSFSVNNDEGKDMNSQKILTTLAAVFVLFQMVACTGANYGKLQRDRDLDNMYLRYEVLPDHLYYITGGYAKPEAILALHKDNELENTRNLWVYVPNVGTTQMRKWIDTISPEQDYMGSNSYFAAYILDPNGKRVGAWYSIEPLTTVKFLEGNKVQVYPPIRDPDIQLNRGFIRAGFH
jgi:hypothetical protein